MQAASEQTTADAATPCLPRARGRARVSFRGDPDGHTRLCEFFQQGCLKIRAPHAMPGAGAELVLINTAGGLTGGDRVAADIVVCKRADVTVTTPGSERIYRSLEGDAVVEQHLSVHAGARLDWLPQETILFNRGRLRRRLRVDLHGDAATTIAESVLLGRTAMGERVANGFFSDIWSVRRDGAMVFADATRIDDPFAGVTGHPATLAGSVAFATVVHAGGDLVRKRDGIRRVADVDATAGVSLVGDLLVARIVAASGMALRRALISALLVLRDGRAMPRLWNY